MRAAGWPSFSTTRVGMLTTPKRSESWGSSSTLTLPMTARPPRRVETSSRIGPCMRHGPHQGAQKSSSTGLGWAFTFSKAWVVTWMTLDMDIP